MKKLIFLFVILTLISLACSLPLMNSEEEEQPSQPTAEFIFETSPAENIDPTNTVYSPPTARPTSDETVTPTTQIDATNTPESTPTEEPSACPVYGKEEFSSPNDCWPNTIDDVLSVSSVSDWNKISVKVADDRLEFLTRLSEDIFLYSFYKDNQYDEVVIRSSVSKIEPSANGNGFTLLCHVNQDGWYEARVASNGIFEINQFDQLKKQQGGNPYLKLASGGAPNFKTTSGNENIIEWQCGYDYLRLLVNDKQVWEKDDFSNLNSGGGVGVGLASYSGTMPRHIGFEWVEILEP